MRPRSLRTDVRNPILSLPSAKRLAELPPATRAVLHDLLGELAQDARYRADTCWAKHKAPMAAYWKACAVYAGHIRRALKGRPQLKFTRRLAA